MSKDIALLITLPPDLKAWVDDQAADLGLEAVTWLRMQVFAMRKRQGLGYDAPDGPATAPADLDAIVSAKLAEAEVAGLTAPRVDPDAPPPLDAANVRPLRRPAPPFSTLPGHFSGLMG